MTFSLTLYYFIDESHRLSRLFFKYHRRHIIKRTVWPNVVVVIPPLVYFLFRFFHISKPILVETLIADTSVIAVTAECFRRVSDV
jgi:hypothetical protein